MILNDLQIRELAHSSDMISPFIEEQHCNNTISYGLSSFGYDARLSHHMKIFHNTYSGIVDPKNFDVSNFVEVESALAARGSYFNLPPHSFALGKTLEQFKIPRNVLAVCMGKSTYARCGIIVNVTPLEPEWKGHVTLELSNTTPLPARVYAGEGVCQFIFLAGESCGVSYNDRKGKYQNQKEITLPKV